MRRRVPPVLLALTALTVLSTGIAWASSFSLTSKDLSAARVTTPVMYPVSIAFTNGGGGVGKAANGDSVKFTWSQPVSPASLCAGSTGANFTYKWTITNSAGNDVLAPIAPTGASPCPTGLNMGTIDLGATTYNASTNGTVIEFSGAHSFSLNNTVLTVVLSGAKNGGSAGQVVSGVAATWAQSSTLLDTSGRSCSACQAKTTTTVQF